VLVAVPAARPPAIVGRLGSRWWAIVPAVSVAAVVAALSADRGSARALTYLALVAVPLLAVAALARGPRWTPALAATALFALAWARPASLGGEAAALILTALSCVALAGLLAALAPARWCKAGIVAMAIVDAVLVGADLLQAPNDALNAAAPGAGLPRLQSVLFGSAQMGYGDLFIAAALGAVLAASRPRQLLAAGATAAFALAFDVLFLMVPELPATVPIALALIALELSQRPRPRPRAPALSAAGGARAGRRPAA
jgi:hypothetical protein